MTKHKPGPYRLYLMNDTIGESYLFKPNLTLPDAGRLAREHYRKGGWSYILRPDSTDIRDRSNRPIWRIGARMNPDAKLMRWGNGKPNYLLTMTIY